MNINPYQGLPDYQFWRRSVSNIEPFKFDPLTFTRFKVGKDMRVATVGSCFAQHISNRLSKIGFNYFVTEPGEHIPLERRKAENYGVFTARFGNIYTTRQLLQLFNECYTETGVTPSVWSTSEGRYVDALRPQIVPGGFASVQEVLADRARHLVAVREMFEDCDILVLTLGLTETWRSRVDGKCYPVAPGVSGGCFDPALHEFINLDVIQVMSDLEDLLSRLKKLNPDVKVILTISPVPLIATYEPRNVLVSTTYSKSVLRVAAEMVYRKYEWVDYFPSYEIITGNYNNSAYFEADYRNINTLGVDHVMRNFLKHYTEHSGTETLTLVSESSAYVAAGSYSDIVCDEEAIEQIRI
jgi:hypothetical protein